jgi:hypothetical protein
MKMSVLVRLAVFVGVALTLSATGLSGWAAAAVVVGAVILAIPLGITRFRQERNLARALWRALTTR